MWRRLTSSTTGTSSPAPIQTPDRVIPLTGMRGTIARRMSESLNTMAQLTLMVDVDMDRVVADRTGRRGDDVVPGYTDYVVMAVAAALREHPHVNSQVSDEGVAYLPDVHVGLAVALDDGLVVPAVRHADQQSLVEIASDTTRLTTAAREGALSLADMDGSTFSVTALGMFGVDGFTPVGNPPNTAILGVGRLRDDVAFGPANLGLDAVEVARRVEEALDDVGAAGLAEQAPHHLSGGERRRAAVASVLSMNPEILVLDEPTSGIDPLGRHELAALLRSLSQTQLVVTHDLPFALATCARSLVLDGGKIALDLETETLLNDPDLLTRHRLALPFGYRS